jgi:hypothetical protein
MSGRVANAELQETRLSTREAAELAGVNADLIYQWRRRGLLVPVEVDATGHPKYLGVDVLRVERDTRTSSHARERKALIGPRRRTPRQARKAPVPAVGRWQAFVQPDEAGCWRWQGSLNKHGYGRFTLAGRQVFAHRFAYETFVGPIPSELEIDHLCRVRDCVNPDHLELVTHKENGRRTRRRFCKRGHDLADAYYKPSGGRACRQCRRVAAKRDTRHGV